MQTPDIPTLELGVTNMYLQCNILYLTTNSQRLGHKKRYLYSAHV